MLPRSLLRQKTFWASGGLVVLLLTLGSVWAVRSLQRAEVRGLLNAQTGFRNPALEVTFPRFVIENAASKQVLEPGVRLGLWTLQHQSGKPDFWEVRLNDQGRRLFSVVGNQIIATFRAGNREVTSLLDLKRNDGSRQARFRYTWKELHPSIGVLGATAPEIGREYEGEALLFYENDRWSVLHWTTPPLDEAVARFRALESAPNESARPDLR